MHSKEIWPFLFLVGMLLFNYPIMEIVQPVHGYYLYLVWAVLIFIIGFLVTARDHGEK